MRRSQTVEKVGQPQASYNFYHLNFKKVLIQKQLRSNQTFVYINFQSPKFRGFCLFPSGAPSNVPLYVDECAPNRFTFLFQRLRRRVDRINDTPAGL